MTREEYIHGYAERSGVLDRVTHYGLFIGGRERVAISCDCGDEGCNGWQMVSLRELEWSAEHFDSPRDKKMLAEALAAIGKP